MTCERIYEVKPLPLFGAEVVGIDLKTNVKEDAVAKNQERCYKIQVTDIP